MGLLNHLMFDDISSWTYGFYIDGQAVFNAPARRGETVTVPGRNGTLFLEEDTFDNITVTYNVFFAANSDSDFAEQLAGFRAALLSKRGYLRLTDTYHPEEFRLALYKSGLEVDPVQYKRAGEFKLEFDCKPQRYLLSGEMEYVNPTAFENPTLFPASPLLKVWGYGELAIDDRTIRVEDRTLGRVKILGYSMVDTDDTLYASFTNTTFNTGDAASTDFVWQTTFVVDGATPGTITATAQEASLSYGVVVTNIEIAQNGYITVTAQWPDAYFAAGVASSWTKSLSVRVEYTDEQTQEETYTTVGLSVDIDFLTDGVEMSTVEVNDAVKVSERRYIDTGLVNSSISSLGNPLYIDCESGEAYKFEDGEKISVNSGVWLGEDLPVVRPGYNYIMREVATMPNIRVIPRWWTL